MPVVASQLANFSHAHCGASSLHLFVYIINLKIRKDRFHNILGLTRQVHLPCSPQAGRVHIQRIDASNGTEPARLNDEWQLSTLGALRWSLQGLVPNIQLFMQVLHYWTRNVTRGEAGLYLSHIRALRAVSLNARRHSAGPRGVHLVLEDDASFDPHTIGEHLFGLHLQLGRLPGGWDVLNLAPLFPARRHRPSATGPPLIRAGYMWLSHALLVSPEGARKITRVDRTRQNIVAYDEFLPALAWSHPRTPLNQLFLPYNERLRYYGTRVTFVDQASDGTHDTEP